MESQFKYLGGSRNPLGRTRELFRSPITGDTVMVDKDWLTVAATCRQFASLEAHAANLRTRRGTAAQPAERWDSLLQSAVAAGVLVSSEDLENYILGKLVQTRQPCTIDSIAIPTRNRPAMLTRLLGSLSSHLQQMRHSADVYVLDSSDSPEMQQANLDAVRAHAGESHFRLRYGNRQTVKRFATALAEASGVPLALTSFALEASTLFPVSMGAAQNALLLETIGHGVLFIDDDVTCTFVSTPGSRLRVDFDGDAWATWFFESWERVQRCRFEPLDMVGVHQCLLNLDRSAVDIGFRGALPIDTSHVSSRFLRAIRQGNAKVVVSGTGVVGDSGWDDPFGYFILGDDTVARLTKSEEMYRAAMKNRLILSGPSGICVSDQGVCHSMCMGIDNTSLLPPFTPVMRGQDLVFGQLISKCVPGGLLGNIPAGILHQPGESREFAPDAAKVRAGRLMAGEMLGLLTRLEPSRGSSSAALMKSLGGRLRECGECSDEEFDAHVRAAVEPMVVMCLQQLQSAIERHGTASSFWLEDALEIRESVLDALKTRHYSTPLDLEHAFGRTDGGRHFRRFVEDFGALLAAWPDMVSAVSAVHQQGIHVCCAPAESQ